MKVKSTTEEKGSNFEKPLIDEGMYEATLKEINRIKDGDYGKRVAFIYSIDEKEVSLAFTVYIEHPANKNNKLGETVMAHGVELNDSEIELDALIGTKAKVVVEDYEYVENGENKKASTISKVKSLAN